MEEKKMNWRNFYIGLMGVLILLITLFYWLMTSFS